MDNNLWQSLVLDPVESYTIYLFNILYSVDKDVKSFTEVMWLGLQ